MGARRRRPLPAADPGGRASACPGRPRGRAQRSRQRSSKSSQRIGWWDVVACSIGGCPLSNLPELEKARSAFDRARSQGPVPGRGHVRETSAGAVEVTECRAPGAGGGAGGSEPALGVRARLAGRGLERGRRSRCPRPTAARRSKSNRRPQRPAVAGQFTLQSTTPGPTGKPAECGLGSRRPGGSPRPRRGGGTQPFEATHALRRGPRLASRPAFSATNDPAPPDPPRSRTESGPKGWWPDG